MSNVTAIHKRAINLDSDGKRLSLHISQWAGINSKLSAVSHTLRK